MLLKIRTSECKTFACCLGYGCAVHDSDRLSKTNFFECEIRRHVVTRRRGLHQTQRLHEPHRHEPEIEFGWIVAQAQKVRIVVMVVLKAGAEGRHDRQPVADIHRIDPGPLLRLQGPGWMDSGRTVRGY